MSDHANRILALLQPKRDAYLMTSGITANNGSGKVKTRSSAVHEDVTVALIDAHLQDAANTVALYPHCDDKHVVFSGLDLDEYDDLDELRSDICSRIKRWDAPFIVVRSKSGGLHVLNVSPEPMLAKKQRVKLRQWAEAFGHPHCEVFPKQDTVTGNSVGNPLNLMLAGNLSGDHRRCVYDEHGKPITNIEDALAYIEERRRILLPPPMADGPPCLQRHALETVGDGERNTVIQAVAIYAKQAFSDEFREELEDWNESHVSPPLSPQRIGMTFKSNQKNDYQYKCDDLARFCNKEMCRRREFGIDGGLPGGAVEIPSNQFSYTDAATGIFERFESTLFARGGEVVSVKSGKIEIVEPNRFQSEIEKLGDTYMRAMKTNGKVVWQRALCSKASAETMLASDVRHDILQEIKLVSSVPVLNPDGSVMTPGYNSESCVFVTGDLVPTEFEFDAAVDALMSLLDDFVFLTKHDKSRAFAMLITPAFRMSGLIPGPVPVDYSDAVESQSGKGTRLGIIRKIYGVEVAIDGERKDGIGSLDDSIAKQFLEARGFIVIDNYRGKYDSPYVEMALTAPDDMIKVRIMRHDPISVDISRQMLQFSSNDAQLTPDMSNRCCVVTIRKQPKDYKFKHTDILSHVAENRAMYLGACLSIAKHFVDHMKRGPGIGHDMRLWLGTMEPIIEKAGLVSLMTDHDAKKERLQKAGSNFLMAILAKMNPTVEYTATEIVEQIIDIHNLEWPEPIPATETAKKMRVGLIMKKTFDGETIVTVEGYTLNKFVQDITRKEKGDTIQVSSYSIEGDYVDDSPY